MISNINEMFDKISEVLNIVADTQVPQSKVYIDESELFKVKAYKIYDDENNSEEIHIKILFKDLEEQ